MRFRKRKAYRYQIEVNYAVQITPKHLHIFELADDVQVRYKWDTTKITNRQLSILGNPVFILFLLKFIHRPSINDVINKVESELLNKEAKRRLENV